MSLKAKVEAIIYAADEPVTLDQIATVLKDDLQADLRSAASAEGEEPAAAAEINPPEAGVAEAQNDEKARAKQERAYARHHIRDLVEKLMAEYAAEDRGIEVREVAGGYRMSTKPEHHDAIRSFAKSLKSPIKLSLQALETLAVIAYKQPVTAPEISEIRGVDCGGVLGSLLARKLITTSGRKQVIGRPILYKTTKDFLLRFGLKDIDELPSMEEFEKMAADHQDDLFVGESVSDATGVPDVPEEPKEVAAGEEPELEGYRRAEPA